MSFDGQAMKFRFSIKSLFITTTVFSVLMGIAVWLDLITHWRLVGAIACYLFIYLFIVCLCFGPRYFRELMEFREKRNSQRLVRASLEEETRKLMAAAKANDQENQDTEKSDS